MCTHYTTLALHCYVTLHVQWCGGECVHVCVMCYVVLVHYYYTTTSSLLDDDVVVQSRVSECVQQHTTHTWLHSPTCSAVCAAAHTQHCTLQTNVTLHVLHLRVQDYAVLHWQGASRWLHCVQPPPGLLALSPRVTQQGCTPRRWLHCCATT